MNCSLYNDLHWSAIDN